MSKKQETGKNNTEAPIRYKKLRTALNFIFNPRLLVCLGIAWMITNGWAYLFLLFGGLFGINWMLVVGGAYCGMLWFPFTPEKIITVVIAMFLLKCLFPGDQKTLLILHNMHEKIKTKMKQRKEKARDK